MESAAQLQTMQNMCASSELIMQPYRAQNAELTELKQGQVSKRLNKSRDQGNRNVCQSRVTIFRAKSST